MRSRSIAPAAARPASVFTSIGKNVITATTAVLDGQSKPNHITMMGAMPTIGSAETKFPIGSSPRAEEGEAMGDHRHQEPGAAADGVAGEHAAHEGLHEILAQHRQRGTQSAPRSHSATASGPTARRSRAPRPPRGRTRSRRTAGGSRGRWPAQRLVARLQGRHAGHDQARGEPCREHQRPEAGAGAAGDAGSASSRASRRR